MAAIIRASRALISRPGVYWRSISTTHNVFNSEERLEKAKQRVMQLTEDPGNQNKLKLYALYKQATVGKCNISKPGMLDFVGQAKWESWNSLGDMDSEQAITKYCDLVDSLVGSKSTEQEQASTPVATADREGILVTDEGGVRTITLNRPNKKNAITTKMYSDIEDILNSSATDQSVRTVMFTGSGDYYCSGNDLSNFLNIPPEGPEKLARDSSVLLKNYVESYIKFPKPLIAAINGPAVGISVTVLCLFDLVYAADHATFHTPFMQLGQSPEGCSSFMFPRIMGPAKANEMLILGRKLTAAEAYDSGLVTRVYPQNEFNERVKEIASEIAQLPPNSVLKSKELIRSTFNSMLLEQNEKECELLVERWLSEECMTAIMNFMQRKKK